MKIIELNVAAKRPDMPTPTETITLELDGEYVTRCGYHVGPLKKGKDHNNGLWWSPHDYSGHLEQLGGFFFPDGRYCGEGYEHPFTVVAKWWKWWKEERAWKAGKALMWNSNKPPSQWGPLPTCSSVKSDFGESVATKYLKTLHDSWPYMQLKVAGE